MVQAAALGCAELGGGRAAAAQERMRGTRGRLAGQAGPVSKRGGQRGDIEAGNGIAVHQAQQGVVVGQAAADMDIGAGCAACLELTGGKRARARPDLTASGHGQQRSGFCTGRGLRTGGGTQAVDAAPVGWAVLLGPLGIAEVRPGIVRAIAGDQEAGQGTAGQDVASQRGTRPPRQKGPYTKADHRSTPCTKSPTCPWVISG